MVLNKKEEAERRKQEAMAGKVRRLQQAEADRAALAAKKLEQERIALAHKAQQAEAQRIHAVDEQTAEEEKDRCRLRKVNPAQDGSASVVDPALTTLSGEHKVCYDAVMRVERLRVGLESTTMLLNEEKAAREAVQAKEKAWRARYKPGELSEAQEAARLATWKDIRDEKERRTKAISRLNNSRYKKINALLDARNLADYLKMQWERPQLPAATTTAIEHLQDDVFDQPDPAAVAAGCEQQTIVAPPTQRLAVAAPAQHPQILPRSSSLSVTEVPTSIGEIGEWALLSGEVKLS